METQRRPTDATIKQWIDDINTKGEGLNDWEKVFMPSVTRQFEERGWLTPKQIERVELIYCNRVPLRRFKEDKKS